MTGTIALWLGGIVLVVACVGFLVVRALTAKDQREQNPFDQ